MLASHAALMRNLIAEQIGTFQIHVLLQSMNRISELCIVNKVLGAHVWTGIRTYFPLGFL
jgi:hypothetical protein